MYKRQAINGYAAPSSVTSALVIFLSGILLISEGLSSRGLPWLKPFWARTVLGMLLIGHANYLAIRILMLDSLDTYIRMPFAVFGLGLMTLLYWNLKRGLDGFALMIFGWGVFLAAIFIKLGTQVEALWLQYVITAAVITITTATIAWIFHAALNRRDKP